MAMRDLVTGGAACAVPGSSNSNPLGALANALIGSSSKTQERLQEIPTSTLATSGSNLYTGTEQPLTVLPGSEFEQQHLQRDGQIRQIWRCVGQDTKSPNASFSRKRWLNQLPFGAYTASTKSGW